MSFFTWLVVIVTALCLRSLFRAICTPLRHIPGPLLARFTRLWYLYSIWRGDFHIKNAQLHRRYGPIVRLSPYEYSIDDPRAVPIVYGHGTSFIKGHWYSASGDPDFYTEDIFSGRNPSVHAVNRRKISGLYAMSNLVKLEEPMNECIDVFEERLLQAALSRREIDLQWWTHCFAFDVISAISVAKPYGFLNRMTDPIGLVSTLTQFLIYSAYVGVYSEFHPLIFRLMKILGLQGKAAAFDLAVRQIQQRMKEQDYERNGDDRQDFLSQLLHLHRNNPGKLRLEDVIGVIQGNIIAGSDTTSVSLTSALWHIFRDERILTKLRNEVDEKFAAGELSRSVKFSEAQKLPYLQAVIREALRLYPATGLPLWRIVPKGGVELAGTYFPQGATVGINAWVAHANTQVFGLDAADFRPERWLESKEKAQEMDRYFLSFGYGSRTCIGKNISLIELSRLIPIVVRKFDLKLSLPEKGLVSQGRFFFKPLSVRTRVEKRAF